MTLNRRSVLIAAGAASLPISAFAAPARGSGYSKGAFTHGVASGDPLAESVVIWTRFLPPGGGTGRIGWEIASDEAFARVVRRGVTRVDAFTDFCTKVDVRGLLADGRYFYRFLAADGPSPTGLTRTAPAAGAESLTLALFSCSNLPFGRFHAYAHAAARADVDLCVHVGDYIYEYQRGKYPSADQAMSGRVIEPAGEIISFNDYHRRYQSYRADPDLQEVHRTKPFITVWDDHELANDAWMHGAQEHDPKTEGDYATRIANAASAYWDWMPIRGVRAAPWRLYRRFDWGRLATILPLDTRLIGRDEPLDYQGALGPAMAQGGMALMQALGKFKAEQLDNPARSLMGRAQEDWFAAELTRAKARGARWQIVPQQIVMGQQIAPAEAQQFLPTNAPDFVKQRFAAAAALGQAGLPWNLDSWGGYPKARERFLAACAQRGSNVVVLAGDSHNAWANTLPGGKDGGPAALEVAGTSVTSPGMEVNLSNAAPGAREAAMLRANKELAFCDLTHKGYAAVTVTQAGVSTEFVQFASVRGDDPTPTGRAVIAAEATDAGVRPWVVGKA
jgi:alkaline phosphatase D